MGHEDAVLPLKDCLLSRSKKLGSACNKALPITLKGIDFRHLRQHIHLLPQPVSLSQFPVINPSPIFIPGIAFPADVKKFFYGSVSVLRLVPEHLQIPSGDFFRVNDG